MLDLQVNGFGGIDYNNSNLDPEDFEKSLQKMLATGVTSCLPTLISASEIHLKSCFQALEKGRRNSELALSLIHISEPTRPY